jgi:hypothetical protein
MCVSLRALFGPNRSEIWGQLSEQIGAQFVGGGRWRGGKVVAQVKEWTVTLDTYTVNTGKSSTTFTRMRAPYVNADGFRFKVYRKGLFSGLAKTLGMQDVEVGEPGFDRDFIIKGSDESRLRALFAEPKVRNLIQAQPQIRLEVVDDEGWFGARFPEGVDELRFTVHGVIKDVAQLKSLFDLFAVVLDRLCSMGSAYDRDPEVSLK